MTIHTIAWILIALEAVVFLAWAYNAWFSRGGTDAAGRGLGQAFTLALGVYLLVNTGILLLRYTLPAMIMAAIPLVVTVYGLWRWWRTRGN